MKKFKTLSLIAIIGMVLLATVVMTANHVFVSNASNKDDIYVICCEYSLEYYKFSRDEDYLGLALFGTPKHPICSCCGKLDDTIHANDGVVSGRRLITNYTYFTSAPQHGRNRYGSCGPVAAQLILS